jgi:hypothetical protein
MHSDCYSVSQHMWPCVKVQGVEARSLASYYFFLFLG